MKGPAPHEDRGFDPEPSVRRAARALYEETRGLPIISPHGHVDPRLLAENEPFPDPATLIVTPDHYILRMLFAHGVALESLGVKPRSVYPVGFWLAYLSACRTLARRAGVSIRTLDKALWQHSKERTRG